MGVIRALLDARLTWWLLGTAAVWAAGQRALEGLARDPRFLATPQFDGAAPPPWGGDEVVRPILGRLEALGPVNLFDPRFEERVRGALAEVPGVSSVTRIRRRWPNHYSVGIRLRRPVAVARGREAVPVTADAVTLPYAPYARACEALLEIRGVHDVRAPAPGGTWRSERLADGLATLRQLGPHWEELAPLGLRVIDVSGAANPRQGVVLRGADGIVVRWGRPRAEVGENPVARKIEYLKLAASELERVRGFEIDVRYGALYLRQSAPE